MGDPISHIKSTSGSVDADFVDETSYAKIDTLSLAAGRLCVANGTTAFQWHGYFNLNGPVNDVTGVYVSTLPFRVIEGASYIFRGQGYVAGTKPETHTLLNVVFFDDNFNYVDRCIPNEYPNAFNGVYEKKGIVPSGATFCVVTDTVENINTGVTMFAVDGDARDLLEHSPSPAGRKYKLSADDVITTGMRFYPTGSIGSAQSMSIYCPVMCRPGDRVEYVGSSYPSTGVLAFVSDDNKILDVLTPSTATYDTPCGVAGTAPEGTAFVAACALSDTKFHPVITVVPATEGAVPATAASMGGVTTDAVTIEEAEGCTYGWYEVDGRLKSDSTHAWILSDFMDASSAMAVVHNLYSYMSTNSNVNVAKVSWFDKDKKFLRGDGGNMAEGSIGLGVEIVYRPEGAAFFRLQYRRPELEAGRLRAYTVDRYEEHRGYSPCRCTECGSAYTPAPSFLLPQRYAGLKRKINIIGDSITQGSACDRTFEDSYAGILRNMFRAEYGGMLNYGFESFPNERELIVNEAMLYDFSPVQFARDWDGPDCYGNDTHTAPQGAVATLSFKVRRKFAYMRVSYLQAPGQGGFSITAGGDSLGTFSCAGSSRTCALTDVIDISAYEPGEVFVITADTASGPVSISGVELGDNTEWVTFNNYGRAGIAPGGVVGNLFDKESDADLVVYALGANGTLQNLQSAIKSVKQYMIDNAGDKVVLDLCMYATGASGFTLDNRAKKQTLIDFAKDIDAVYIDVFSYMPKTREGKVNNAFMHDHVHPNNIGHELIASVVAKSLGLSCSSKGMVTMTGAAYVE